MFLILGLVFAKYYPLKWDPLVPHMHDYNEIMSTKGFLKNHNKDIQIENFGDISIFTINFYTKDLSDPTENQINTLSEVLDHAHPTIVCLQGVDEELMKKLQTFIKNTKHYKISNDKKHSTDLSNAHEYFLPIIFDELVLKKNRSDYFITSDPQSILYASWSRFIMKNGTEFTAVNIDLFSSFKNVTSAQFSNIVIDINTDKTTSESPVVISGNIATMSSTISNLMSKNYKNLVDLDTHNRNLSKTTFHARDLLDDDIQRDFILLLDEKNAFETNYARILSDFPKSNEHYPVYAILTLRK